MLGLVNTGSMIAVCDSLLSLCTGQPLASDFTIFGVFRFVCCVVSVLFLCLDEDCNPGWGDCGRPLRLLLVVLLKMVNGYVLFNGDWTIRSNSAWSKKNIVVI